jgi:hypothetical protein
MDDGCIQLAPPIHLVAGQCDCWRCGARMSVVAILCENIEVPDDGPYILSNTEELPPELTRFIQTRCPTFRLTFSKTVGGRYFANNCPKCGVMSGDFYLHSEPGAPFFPTEPDEAAALTIENISINRSLIARTGCGYGTAELILQYARRIGGVQRHENTA